MAAKKIILDTDPGVDDVLAILLALASAEIEVLAITTVHGNIDSLNTTRNVLSLFNVLKTSSETWTERVTKTQLVTLAAGASTPLNKEGQLDAAYFHGRDGLGDVSLKLPQYLPPKGWESHFPSLATAPDSSKTSLDHIKISPRPAHEEILHQLRTHEPDSVTIVAVGPLTNLSLALSQDAETFSRAREIVVMGGALTVPGNVTPTSEFNILADPEAAAHVFSYTSATPSSTYPASSPDKLSTTTNARPLKITLLPLDITTTICLSHSEWSAVESTSPLKQWTDVFLQKTFQTMAKLYTDKSIEKVNLSMHDPACIWYLIHHDESADQSTGLWQLEIMDVRVECQGTWTRGMTVIDRRGREKLVEAALDVGPDSDSGDWLSTRYGNRVHVLTRVPESQVFVDLFKKVVFEV